MTRLIGRQLDATRFHQLHQITLPLWDSVHEWGARAVGLASDGWPPCTRFRPDRPGTEPRSIGIVGEDCQPWLQVYVDHDPGCHGIGLQWVPCPSELLPLPDGLQELVMEHGDPLDAGTDPGPSGC